MEQRSLSLLPAWLGFASLVLLAFFLIPVYAPFGWALLALIGIAAVAVLLGSAWLCCQLACLGLFTGILTALPVGFSLKAPQLFALLGLTAWGLARLRRVRSPDFPWHWLLPFGGFILSILPSFFCVERSALSLAESESSLRLLFNYGLLQLFALVVLLEAQSLERIDRLWKLALLSGLASLIFGFGQQLAFYAGVYDPFTYLGQHSSIVDFYGPFLRLSPGTFANEYGEILQTLGILLVAWLVLVPQRRKLPAALMLVLVMIGLVLNFTRASWLVFAAGAFALLIAGRLRLRSLLAIGLLGLVSLGLLLYLSQILLEASLFLSIGQRFGELGQLQSHSAGQRLVTWQLAWEAFLESPLIGQGWGRFGATHNVPLQLLAETGLLGFSGFYGLMAWIGWMFYRGWRQSPEPLVKGLLWGLGMAFVGCLAFDLTNHGIYHFVLWFCISLGLALVRHSLYPPAAEVAKLNSERIAVHTAETLTQSPDPL